MIKHEGEIVAINKYFDDGACEERSQITIDFKKVKKDLHLGKCQTTQ